MVTYDLNSARDVLRMMISYAAVESREQEESAPRMEELLSALRKPPVITLLNRMVNE